MTFRNEAEYLKKAQHFVQKNQFKKAIKVLNEGLQHFLFSIDLHLRKAELLLQMNKATEALEILDKANLLAPEMQEIHLLQIEAMRDAGQFKEGLSLIKVMKGLLLEESISLSHLYQLEASIFICMGENEWAVKSLIAAISTSPSNTEAHDMLWLFVEEHKRYEDSILWYEAILKHNPFSYLAWYNLGQVYAYLGNYAKAIEHFKYSLTLQEDFEPAHYDYAELCFELKHYGLALEAYIEILEAFEVEGDVLMRIGACNFQFKQYNTAIIFFSRALQYDPLDDEVYFEKGNCFAAQKKWDSAIRCYQKALNIADDREDYFAALANAFIQTGAYDEAEVQFLNAIQIAPELTQYWIQYALLLAETGKEALALDTLDEAESITYDSELLYGRIVCLFILGRRQEARYRLGEALLEDFNAHKILFELYPDLEYDSEVLSLISNFTI